MCQWVETKYLSTPETQNHPLHNRASFQLFSLGVGYSPLSQSGGSPQEAAGVLPEEHGRRAHSVRPGEYHQGAFVSLLAGH